MKQEVPGGIRVPGVHVLSDTCKPSGLVRVQCTLLEGAQIGFELLLGFRSRQNHIHGRMRQSVTVEMNRVGGALAIGYPGAVEEMTPTRCVVRDDTGT